MSKSKATAAKRHVKNSDIIVMQSHDTARAPGKYKYGFLFSGESTSKKPRPRYLYLPAGTRLQVLSGYLAVQESYQSAKYRVEVEVVTVGAVSYGKGREYVLKVEHRESPIPLEMTNFMSRFKVLS